MTPQSTGRLIRCVLDNLEAAIEGRPVVNVVNGVEEVVGRRSEEGRS
ncbi:hypothetical protein [Streptosporangium vulgare]